MRKSAMNAKGQQMNAKRRSRERGAVLILTVVVIMVLTTLGMAMVTFTGTEERTAVTYRDTLQVRAVAESGVRIAQQMFQNPEDRRLVPLYSNTSTPSGATPPTYDYYGTDEASTEASLNLLGIFRDTRMGATPARYTGPNNKFFNPPYRGSWGNLFGGDYSVETTPAGAVVVTNISDLRFRRTHPTTGAPIANNWLDRKVNPLLGAGGSYNTAVGQITEIAFYSPPIEKVSRRAYGIATVRVTAEKVDARGRLVARETIEALIGDNNIAPSMLGNGNIVAGNTDTCGSGCEQIHANGSITLGNGTISGGNPTVSATGGVTGGTITPPPATGQQPVQPPMINPWDVTYIPTGSDLNKYYLFTSRQLPAVWTNGLADNPAPVACGLAFCQDYGLEYDISSGVARNRTGTAYLYKWNGNDWTMIDDATNNQFLVSNGPTETFSVKFIAGADTLGSAADTAAAPFNKMKVPGDTYQVTGISPNQDTADAQLATFLVDGKFEMRNNIGNPRPWKITIIAVGSIITGTSTDIRPATAARYMLISGRDIDMQGSYLNDLHFCGSHGLPTTTNEAGMASGIVACHEQFRCQSNSDPMGLIIAESRVNADPTVNSATVAIEFSGGSTNHSYICGFPEWPWVRPTRPVVLSMATAAD